MDWCEHDVECIIQAAETVLTNRCACGVVRIWEEKLIVFAVYDSMVWHCIALSCIDSWHVFGVSRPGLTTIAECYRKI